MDYMQEIAANNARIAELKAELSQLKGQPALGSNELDYMLAAQRARSGDMSGVQYHLNKPEERDRMAKMMAMNASSLTNDAEYQYSTLQDKVAQAEEELAYTPKNNRAAVQQANRNLRQAQINLKMFERKNPNLVRMHWNWRDSAERELGPATVYEPPAGASENTVEGLKARIFDNTYVDPGSGKTFLKNDADPYEIYNYGMGITGAMEDPVVRDLLAQVKSLKTMGDSVTSPTLENLKVFLKNSEYTSNSGRLKGNAEKKRAIELYNALSDAEKNTEEAQKVKRLINSKTQAQVDRDIKDMRAEGLRLLNHVDGTLYDMIMAGTRDKFRDQWGRMWTRGDDGNWSTPNWTKKL